MAPPLKYAIPSGDALVDLFREHGSQGGVATALGVPAHAISNHLTRNPSLREQVRAFYREPSTFCAPRHSYPSDNELVEMMRMSGSLTAVARACGVRRESLRDYLVRRPALDSRMREWLRPKLSEEEAQRRNREGARLYAERMRREHPEETRRKRREQMAKYGPAYRHRWNHYNRLRRKQIDVPDEQSADYVRILLSDPCSYCGAPMRHVDHITALARGGSGEWNNLTAACSACNFSKSASSVLEFLLRKTQEVIAHDQFQLTS